MKKKQLFAAIASVLMITIIATCSAAFPPGYDESSLPPGFTPYVTYIYVTAPAWPVKVGGTAVLTAFIVPPPPNNGGFAGTGSAIEPTPYTNITMEIRAPNGQTTNSGNLTSGDSGAVFYVMTPAQLGTYSVVASWPGDSLHQAVTSRTVTFQVDEDGSPQYDFPGTALPTGYWETPVSAEYREWANLVGPWYQSPGHNASINCFNEYTTAPDTGHVLWKYRGGEGGLIGGEYGVQAYDRAEFLDVNRHLKVVMNGRMYYAEAALRAAQTPLSQQKQTTNILHCIDIRDGHEIWRLGGANDDPYYGGSIVGIPAVPMNGPQANLVITPNVGATLMTRQVDPGGVSRPFMLFYDAEFGRIVRNVTMPSAYAANGLVEIGADGNVYVYMIVAKGNITKWDPFKQQLIANEYGVATFEEGIVWSVPCGPRAPNAITGNRLVVTTGDPDFAFCGWDTQTGQLLYNVSRHDYGVASSRTTGYGGVFAMCSDGYWRKWSTDTGLEVWKATYPEVYPWGYFTVYNSAAAFGNYYGASYSGYYHCFDAATGTLKWAYFAGNTSETSMGHHTFWGAPAASGDGKIIVSEGSQHPVGSPMERGANFVCLNATTGEVIWKYSGRDGGQDSGSKAIAEGRFFVCDHYTGYEYCFYPGKTATTVTASPKTSVEGDTVLIEGTVVDLSPAQPGAACVSDESMQLWMEYLNINGPLYNNMTGVEVTLSVLDANNNYRDIGTATTDPYHDGYFRFAWTPDIDGAYTVYANFEGTGGYWESTAAAGFVVGKAPQSAEEPAVAAPVDNNLLYGILGAAIIAIIIGIIAILLILRKK